METKLPFVCYTRIEPPCKHVPIRWMHFKNGDELTMPKKQNMYTELMCCIMGELVHHFHTKNAGKDHDYLCERFNKNYPDWKQHHKEFNAHADDFLRDSPVQWGIMYFCVESATEELTHDFQIVVPLHAIPKIKTFIYTSVLNTFLAIYNGTNPQLDLRKQFTHYHELAEKHKTCRSYHDRNIYDTANTERKNAYYIAREMYPKDHSLIKYMHRTWPYLKRGLPRPTKGRIVISMDGDYILPLRFFKRPREYKWKQDCTRAPFSIHFYDTIDHIWLQETLIRV